MVNLNNTVGHSESSSVFFRTLSRNSCSLFPSSPRLLNLPDVSSCCAITETWFLKSCRSWSIVEPDILFASHHIPSTLLREQSILVTHRKVHIEHRIPRKFGFKPGVLGDCELVVFKQLSALLLIGGVFTLKKGSGKKRWLF
jgi:hypothetical protein